MQTKASSTSYRQPGLKGDFVAGKIAIREFGVMVRTTRPIQYQLILGAAVCVVALLRPLYADRGVSYVGWLLITIVSCVALSLECHNCVDERIGDAVGEKIRVIRQMRATMKPVFDLPASKLDAADGEPITEMNEYSRLIKDGGAGVMVPMFVMAAVVDLVVLIHG